MFSHSCVCMRAAAAQPPKKHQWLFRSLSANGAQQGLILAALGDAAISPDNLLHNFWAPHAK